MSYDFQGAFEGGLAAAIVETADLDELPRIRVWHALADNEAHWSKTADRVFPVIALRAGPPQTNSDDGVTQFCVVAATVGTNANDDADHDAVAKYQAAVQSVFADIYAQWRGTAGQALNAFTKYIEDNYPDLNTLISIGGYQHGDVLVPFEEGGVNYEGREFIIHYSRSDY